MRENGQRILDENTDNYITLTGEKTFKIAAHMGYIDINDKIGATLCLFFEQPMISKEIFQVFVAIDR